MALFERHNTLTRIHSLEGVGIGRHPTSLTRAFNDRLILHPQHTPDRPCLSAEPRTCNLDCPFMPILPADCILSIPPPVHVTLCSAMRRSARRRGRSCASPYSLPPRRGAPSRTLLSFPVTRDTQISDKHGTCWSAWCLLRGWKTQKWFLPYVVFMGSCLRCGKGCGKRGAVGGTHVREGCRASDR
jgi:hypothetical protein